MRTPKSYTPRALTHDEQTIAIEVMASVGLLWPRLTSDTVLVDHTNIEGELVPIRLRVLESDTGFSRIELTAGRSVDTEPVFSEPFRYVPPPAMTFERAVKQACAVMAEALRQYDEKLTPLS